MNIILFLNLLFEGLVGIVFIFAPEAVDIFAGADPLTLAMVRTYGVAALTIALLSLQMMLKNHEQELLATGLLLLTFFHTGLSVVQYINASQNLSPIAIALTHTFFAVAFLIFYLKEK